MQYRGVIVTELRVLMNSGCALEWRRCGAASLCCLNAAGGGGGHASELIIHLRAFAIAVSCLLGTFYDLFHLLLSAVQISALIPQMTSVCLPSLRCMCRWTHPQGSSQVCIPPPDWLAFLLIYTSDTSCFRQCFFSSINIF